MTLNVTEILDMANSLPSGLWDGKAGICLYLVNKDKDATRKLWNEVIQSLPKMNENIDFFSGLTGIVFTAYKLEENGMKIKEKDGLAAEVDAILFRQFGYNDTTTKYPLLSLSHLVCFEAWLLNKDNNICEEDRIIRSDLLRHLVNIMLEQMSTYDLIEPSNFSLKYLLPNILLALTYACKCNIYNIRIRRTLEEMSRIFVGQMPIIHANRLFMLWALKKLNRLCNLSCVWKEYISLLENNISLDRILDYEVKESIYIADGISGIYWLLKGMYCNEQISPIIKQKMLKLIDYSNEIKMVIENDKYRYNHLGLFSGLSGVMLTKQFIKCY